MQSKSKRHRKHLGSDASAVPTKRTGAPKRQRELNRSVVERTRIRLHSFWEDDVPQILGHLEAGATPIVPRLYVDIHKFLQQVAEDLHSIYPSSAVHPEQVLRELEQALCERRPLAKLAKKNT